jgi:carboxyl-terminal processing protease
MLAGVFCTAAADPVAADFAADAASIERLVNEHYAYLDRYPGETMPMSERLRAKAAAVGSRRELVGYAERALAALADHHAITGSSLGDSWALIPTYSDLWVELRRDKFVVTAVREGSPAAEAGVVPGEFLLAIGDTPTRDAVADFWADIGVAGGGERDAFAARVLAAGRRNAERRLTVGHDLSRPRRVTLPNLYMRPLAGRPVLSSARIGDALSIKFNDSLGQDATIAAFDLIMSRATPGQPVIIDLTDTPSGGNTTIARAVLGWFVTRPTFYQVHSIPSELRRHGVARQWVEQVLPRAGKHHRGKVTVRVGRWTGSMGEGLAIGFDAIGARVEGDPMAGLLGAVSDYRLERTGLTIKLPSERLAHVDGSPREAFRPVSPR